MVERWKPVVGFKGFYEVSDRGRVRSLPRIVKCPGDPRHNGLVVKHYKGRLLSLTPGKRDGYVVAHLLANGKHRSVGVHVLVAEAFIPNPSALPEVNHKTPGKVAKSDNRASKLEWVTSARNIRHSFEQGRQPLKGTEIGNAKLTPVLVKKIRQQYAAGGCSQRSIAQQFDVSQGHVSCIVTAKAWAHV